MGSKGPQLRTYIHLSRNNKVLSVPGRCQALNHLLHGHQRSLSTQQLFFGNRPQLILKTVQQNACSLKLDDESTQINDKICVK